MRKSIISTHHVLAMSAEPPSKKTRMPVTLGYWKIRGVGSSCCLWSVSLLFMSLQFVDAPIKTSIIAVTLVIFPTVGPAHPPAVEIHRHRV